MNVSSNVAIVIPVLDDPEALAALLEQIPAWPDAPHEVLVVSGSESAELRAMCRRHRCRCIETAPNRGAQLDRGARAAAAPVLWFVHADLMPPADGLGAIRAAISEGAEGGYFRFGFQGERTWYKDLLALSVNLRTRLGGVPYGDQGIFVRRDVYLECGGFSHDPLFEEVRLIKRLRARGAFREISRPIQVSPRRWEREGWCRRTLHNRWLATRYMLGAPAQHLARAYRRRSGSLENIES